VTPVDALLTLFQSGEQSDRPSATSRKKAVIEMILFCPDCGEIVEPARGEDGFLHYYCEECEAFVQPRSQPPPEPID
jgi:NADH pyrophosphatase NudC (nudix superfamily)